MTKQEALAKLEQANKLVFEIESVMDIKTSDIRRKGYWARVSIGDFIHAIKRSEKQNIATL